MAEMTDETTALAALLEREFAAMHWPNVNTTNSEFIAARLIAAGVRVAPSPTEDRDTNGACLDCGAGTAHYDWCESRVAPTRASHVVGWSDEPCNRRCGHVGPHLVAPSPETPGLREALDAIPRLRITGEQLDAIDPDPEKVFYTDWDEWDEYVRLDAVRAALASPPAPAGLDVEHPDCGDRCACYLRGWTVVNDEWEAAP